jgi:hypothetical protein
MMTTGGWVFISLFWGFVIIVTGWCFKLVLLEKPKDGEASGGGGEASGGGDDQREKPWAPPDADEEEHP